MPIDLEDERYDGMLKAGGLDAAIIGTTTVNGVEVFAYSTSKVLQKLIMYDGMSQEDALDFYYANIECAYMGPQTPVWVWDLDVCDEGEARLP